MTVMDDGVMRWAIFTNKQCPMGHKMRHWATQSVLKNRKEANRQLNHRHLLSTPRHRAGRITHDQLGKH